MSDVSFQNGNQTERKEVNFNAYSKMAIQKRIKLNEGKIFLNDIK